MTFDIQTVNKNSDCGLLSHATVLDKNLCTQESTLVFISMGKWFPLFPRIMVPNP